MPSNHDYIPVGRIDLPGNWTPEGLKCVSFPCPDDPEYISMLVGLVDQLRYSRSFGRDLTRQGAATVARTWDNALKSQPVEVAECGGNMAFQLRQNETDPWLLEQSLDGGVTWSLAYDYRRTYLGGPPFSGSPDQNADAAANLIQNIYIAISIILGDSGTEAEFIDAATQQMRKFAPTWSEPSILEGMYDDFQDLDPGEQLYYTTECNWLKQFDDMRTNCTPENVVDYFQCIAEYTADWIADEVLEPVKGWLHQTVQSLTGSELWAAAGFGGPGNGETFGEEECVWERVWNPVNGWGPVSLVTDVPYSGIAGTLEADGWHSVRTAYSSGTDNKLGVVVDASGPFHMVSMTGIFDFNGANPDVRYYVTGIINGAWFNQTANDQELTIAPGGGLDCPGQFAIVCFQSSSTTEYVLKQWSIVGSGPVPAFT